MKVLVNGGLNVSQHDGWWAEAWNPAVGWAIRPCASLEELAVQDAEADRRDAESLYQLLEQQAIPEFYELGPDGAPYRWLARMRASMDSLTPRYSANRMVREYVTTCYGPMIEFSAQRTPKVAKALTMELQELALHWPKVRFERLEVNSDSGHQRFRLQLYLNGIPANRVRVELVAEASSAGPRQVTGMTPSDAPGLTSDHQSYHCTVPARPDGHYTPRVRLQDSRLALPLEAPWVHWYR
jgi:starch phosphorylase